MLVLTVTGIATILGFAILASMSLGKQMQSNSSRALAAQYLAESGVNLAIYYLQNPSKAPSLTGGYYQGQTNIGLGSTVDGSVDVSVTNPSKDLYDITAIGYAGPDPANRTSRQLKTRVYVAASYKVTQAANFSGDFTVPAIMSITGSVRADGVLTRALGASISGSIYALGSNVSGAVIPPAFPTKAVPALAQINLYKTLVNATPYYSYVDTDGTTKTGTPDVLPTNVTGTLTASAGNPKRIFYSTNNVTLGDCTINGTIVLTGAGKSLTISGNAQVTPMSGMPGVVVSGSIKYPVIGLNKRLTVNGLLWIGGDIVASTVAATNCYLTVNGALMVHDGTRVDSLLSGSMSVTYVAANVDVPTFSDVDRTPQSVTIIHWGM